MTGHSAQRRTMSDGENITDRMDGTTTVPSSMQPVGG
jgi:hypothetical protein